ncbi:MAG: molybdopterin-dependent oxidoreductase, partial [Desulfobacteraceae bacterium]
MMSMLIDYLSVKSPRLSGWLFRQLLFGIFVGMKVKQIVVPSFRRRLKDHNFTAQIKVRDNSLGRTFTFNDGRITSTATPAAAPDLTMDFKDAVSAVQLMSAPADYLKQINAMKNFVVDIDGPDTYAIWFMQTLKMLQGLRSQPAYGTSMGKGIKRYVNNTNGGPVFVYVRKGKIIRITPVEFDEQDADPWTIEARGRRFTPPRKGTVNPYVFGLKSLIYSRDRLLYPMKRVDFDPHGERNCQNRGVSGYERISWDEALDIVAEEIKRVKRTHGPGAIMNGSGSHHTWGNLGYWLSAKTRFMNSIGSSHVMHNPDSWEGWYWGAMHHWGNSIRNGASDTYGTVEDCLKEAEMIVFWSSDPEST